MRPSTALRSVLLPAPLGPINPRMRPSSTFRSTPSSATVAPNDLRRPCASMHAMCSTTLRCIGREKILRRQPEALNGCLNSRPLLCQETLPLRPKQEFAHALIDEHAQSPFLLDQLL